MKTHISVVGVQLRRLHNADRITTAYKYTVEK